MKCPYNNFSDCLVEECPACTYETIEHKERKSYFPCIKKPGWMSNEEWEKSFSTRTIYKYKFISCNYVKNAITPTPKNEMNIKNHSEVKNIVYNKTGLF